MRMVIWIKKEGPWNLSAGPSLPSASSYETEVAGNRGLFPTVSRTFAVGRRNNMGGLKRKVTHPLFRAPGHPLKGTVETDGTLPDLHFLSRVSQCRSLIRPNERMRIEKCSTLSCPAAAYAAGVGRRTPESSVVWNVSLESFQPWNLSPERFHAIGWFERTVPRDFSRKRGILIEWEHATWTELLLPRLQQSDVGSQHSEVGKHTHMTRGQNFFFRVYNMARRIPKGKVATYGQIAALVGSPRASRQVGWALAQLDSDTKVPWQRVINREGRITIENMQFPKDLQAKILESEGVEVELHDGNFFVDPNKFLWEPKD